jgi:hypothetical protein
MTELADWRKSCDFSFIETLFRNFAIASSNKIEPAFRKGGGAAERTDGRKGTAADHGYAASVSC